MTHTALFPDRIRLGEDAWGALTVDDGAGRTWSGVTVVRPFPLSAPGWVSLVDADGKELICVSDLATLPPDARGKVEAALAEREFLPTVKRIISISGRLEPCSWTVETDRGQTTFVLKSEDDVRRLGPHRVMFIDGNGIRYLVPDVRQLDAKSRRTVERYM